MSITFSVCLSIASAYLHSVCMLFLSGSLLLSPAQTDTNTHTFPCSLMLTAVCRLHRFSVSSALSHPTLPTLSPGKCVCLMGREGGMNELTVIPSFSEKQYGKEHSLYGDNPCMQQTLTLFGHALISHSILTIVITNPNNSHCMGCVISMMGWMVLIFSSSYSCFHASLLL